MTAITKAQRRILKRLGQQPIGHHFAENASDRAIFGALVRAGLARKAWNFGSWSYIATDAGVAALSKPEPVGEKL